ncbi:TPA: phage antirepressor KilAC domain-containing protein, partial [Clostridioides difficile]|nr:phage antirepressor KilAC domain-containing protein [Clostridioides difficile]HBF1358968.1 phage antirepressor KilAC domain-containing protein [Clostridioides difficile]HEK9055178.1 phage antirepressor KilAC domain-containing protein [Clostridioides difficile]
EVEEKEQLQLENQEKDKVIQLQQPKVLFADSVASSDNSILVGELAKLLRQNGIDTGQNRLFDWLRNNGYLIKRKGEDYNTPTQKSVDLGVIETKEGTRVHPDGHTSITKTPKITGKGQIYFINKFKSSKQLSMLS